MEIVNGHQGQLQGAGHTRPQQETIRSVEGQGSATVFLDHRLREIAEELVEIVQVAICAGPNVRGVENAVPEFVARGPLEFAIRTAAPVRKLDCTCGSIGDGRNNEVVRCMSLLIRETKKQISRDFAVQFQIPRKTARLTQRTG